MASRQRDQDLTIKGFPAAPTGQLPPTPAPPGSDQGLVTPGSVDGKKKGKDGGTPAKEKEEQKKCTDCFRMLGLDCFGESQCKCNGCRSGGPALFRIAKQIDRDAGHVGEGRGAAAHGPEQKWLTSLKNEKPKEFAKMLIDIEEKTGGGSAAIGSRARGQIALS